MKSSHGNPGKERQRVPRRHALLAAAIATLAAACAHQSTDWPVAEAGSGIGADLRVAACRDALTAAGPGEEGGLDAGDIRILNWNVQKKHGPAWRSDFDRLAADVDFVLMQEASLSRHTGLVDGHHSTFAPGYRTADRVTGVLTLSRHAPVARCYFTAREPWLGTPKSTSITLHALAGGRGTLAVVNVHAVNFGLGLRDYRAQFARILEVLRDHEGPIILAGDFNTWRPSRMAVVTVLADDLGLEAVPFADDGRARYFGSAVDHIYVRDLALRQSETDRVVTSDHNPMTAVFAMPFVAP